jgi:hypothetical protein
VCRSGDHKVKKISAWLRSRMIVTGVATPLGSSLLHVSLSLTMTVREALVASVTSSLTRWVINGMLYIAHG